MSQLQTFLGWKRTYVEGHRQIGAVRLGVGPAVERYSGLHTERAISGIRLTVMYIKVSATKPDRQSMWTAEDVTGVSYLEMVPG